MDERVPVTVVTGFLGSGKTTLLNHLLREKHGRRIAIIENEFGAIDIDGDLVAGQETLEGTQVTKLSNGCLCCTVRDDMISALNNLWEKRSQFDHVLIETTGLANPGPIISSFYASEALTQRMRLDGVLTVVDAKHVGKRLDEEKPNGVVNEAIEQVAYADRIIVNKTDLVSEAELLGLRERLRGINSLAQQRSAQRSVVDVDYVLGIGGFDLSRVEDQVNSNAAGECSDPACSNPEHHHHHHHHEEEGGKHHHEHDHTCGPECSGDHHHTHAHAHGAEGGSHDHGHSATPSLSGKVGAPVSAAAVRHDDKVSSVAFEVEGEMDRDTLQRTLAALLDVRAEDLYRIKGILAIRGVNERFVYQGVHTHFEGVRERPWREGERRTCRMVFIGRELERDVLQEVFSECLVAPEHVAVPT